MTRVIVLGNGRHVTLGQYVRAWRTAKAAAPGTRFSHGCCGWWSVTREEALRDFEHGLHDRINLHDPRSLVGWRKLASDWQRETRNAARQLNYPRRVIHWLPAWLKPRFAHRLKEAA
jgi:hypothetical protein